MRNIENISKMLINHRENTGNIFWICGKYSQFLARAKYDIKTKVFLDADLMCLPVVFTIDLNP